MHITKTKIKHSPSTNSPHPATGHKLGDLIFQHGYTNQVPSITPRADIITNGHHNEIIQRQKRINSSIHRKIFNIQPGDTVIIKNQQRLTKSSFIFWTRALQSYIKHRPTWA